MKLVFDRVKHCSMLTLLEKQILDDLVCVSEISRYLLLVFYVLQFSLPKMLPYLRRILGK